ncbi:hypothetical protein P20480_3520 [Pseudoalteromonas sp. BSi20480]|nr:hypothetical protein P20480_3520 [Pseudoalteromonas sp. BSi20480]
MSSKHCIKTRKAAKKVNFNATYQWCAGGAMWKLNHQHV